MPVFLDSNYKRIIKTNDQTTRWAKISNAPIESINLKYMGANPHIIKAANA